MLVDILCNFFSHLFRYIFFLSKAWKNSGYKEKVLRNILISKQKMGKIYKFLKDTQVQIFLDVSGEGARMATSKQKILFFVGIFSSHFRTIKKDFLVQGQLSWEVEMGRDLRGPATQKLFLLFPLLTS